MTGTWVKISTPASVIAAGEIDGDNIDDLIGSWSSGLWVKYSSTAIWERLTSALPRDIDTGIFGTGAWDAEEVGFVAPIGGYAGGPDRTSFTDLSEEGPGGWNFVFQEERNLVPQEEKSAKMNRKPGPEEPGFTSLEQDNLIPQHRVIESRSKRKK